jgi:glycosyltransferase involved in cell wall biosynthesis
MRIAQVCSATNRIYGAAQSLTILASGLRDAGHDCRFITFEGKPYTEEMRVLGFDAYPVRVRTKIDPLAVSNYIKLFRDLKIDLVHTHLSTSSLNGCLAARLARIPCVATVHGMSGKLSFAFADRMIGVSKGVRAHLVGQGVSASKIEVVYNGIPTPPETDRQEARREFGYTDSDLVVGTVARLTPMKGIDTLIRSFKSFSEVIPSGRLLLVGNGDGEAEYRALVGSLGLEEKVTFAGYRDPVWKEAMGMSVVEAMMMALPVVSTDVGGLPEVVSADAGVLVPARDEKTMAAALLALANDEKLRRDLGEGARQRAKAVFGASEMVEETLAVYERLLNGNPVLSV